MKHKPLYKSKTTIQHINIAIIGFVKAGASIKEIVNTVGLSALDVEAVIIEHKLSVKPEGLKAIISNWNSHQAEIHNRHAECMLALEFGYKQCEKGENIHGAILNYNKISNP